MFPNPRVGWIAGLVTVMVIGVGLRVVHVEDMEFKGEEQYTFERTQRIGKEEPLPWAGMGNSAGVPHPGMSVWAFWALARLFHAETPPKLDRACQLVNVAALIGLPIFVLIAVPAGQREIWYWACALAAVNPLEVLFQRKIWPPSILPPFTLFFLVGWWFRDRRWGAFFWGLTAAVMSQIHPGGFLFAAGFGLWATLFRRGDTRWSWSLLGGLIGILPALPWIVQLLHANTELAASRHSWTRPLEMQFWIYWIADPMGFGLEHPLGQDFADFLRAPTISGFPTCLCLLLHVILGVLGVLVLARALAFIWQHRRRWREWFIGDQCPSAMTQNAAMWGYGMVLTLTGLPIYRHYMIITFPLMFIWLARLALIRAENGTLELHRGRKVLAALCVTQLLLTVGFLTYIHSIDRPVRGDYGTPFRVKRQSDESPMVSRRD